MPARSVLASTFEGRPFLGPNDLVADRKGGVYFTDPGGYPPAGQYLTELPSVYYLKPDGSVIKIADDIPRPNGIILSPDEKTLYVSNTLGAYVIAFDVQPDGSVRNERNFARLAGIAMTNRGVRSGADGIAVDEAGRLYVTSTIGVQVFSPEGKHLGTIPVGNPDGPQNIAFAGPDKKTLYIVGDGAVWKVAMLAQGPKDGQSRDDSAVWNHEGTKATKIFSSETSWSSCFRGYDPRPVSVQAFRAAVVLTTSPGARRSPCLLDIELHIGWKKKPPLLELLRGLGHFPDVPLVIRVALFE